MGRENPTPAVIQAKLQEMAEFQSYMHLHCGGKGTKMIFILTSIPNEWTLPGERLMDRKRLIIDDVNNLFTSSGNPIVEMASSAFGDAEGSPDNDGEGEVKEPDEESSRHTTTHVPCIDDIRYSFRMSRTVARTNVDQMLHYHQNPNCWIPVADAMGRRYKQFVDLLDTRMTAILREMHLPDGPDIATFFVTSSESDREEMSTFKYEGIYDEVNRSILDAQVRFLKNPSVSLRPLTRDGKDEDKEPVPANPIAVDILCSCDYSTTKMDQLRKCVRQVVLGQKHVAVPASLNFVPDA